MFPRWHNTLRPQRPQTTWRLLLPARRALSPPPHPPPDPVPGPRASAHRANHSPARRSPPCTVSFAPPRLALSCSALAVPGRRPRRDDTTRPARPRRSQTARGGCRRCSPRPPTERRALLEHHTAQARASAAPEFDLLRTVASSHAYEWTRVPSRPAFTRARPARCPARARPANACCGTGVYDTSFAAAAPRCVVSPSRVPA